MTTDPAKSALRPRARLLRALGADLISNESVALVELVKNAYDADAQNVVIRFVPPLAEGEGAIEVVDDGHGMSADTIANTWIEIATANRRRGATSRRFGRAFLGEKGIGRFAAAKLAQIMTLASRTDNTNEVVLDIDWNAFSDETAYLDEIPIGWREGQTDYFAPDGAANTVRLAWGLDPTAHGTMLHLGALTQAWTEAHVSDLRRDLSRLIAPGRPRSRQDDVFTIIIDATGELEHLAGPVEPNPALANPPYRLTASVGADGHATGTVTVHGNSQPFDLRIPGDDNDELPCGAFTVNISVWDRDLEGIKALGLDVPMKDFREDLSAIAGVSLYRDGFRVLPYGEAGNDWLGLDRSRVNNPQLRLSNNQVIGEVAISARGNAALRDQTNREGLIDNSAYRALVRAIKAVLNELEWRREQHRTRERTKTTTNPPVDTPSGEPRIHRRPLFSEFEVSDIADAVRERLPTGDPLVSIVEEREQLIADGVRRVRETLSRYSRLAVLGRLVDDIIHDGQHPTGRIVGLTDLAEQTIGRRDQACPDKLAAVTKHLAAVRTQTDALTALFRRIQPFGGRRRGRPTEYVLEQVVRDAVDVLSSRAAQHKVDVQLDASGRTQVRLDPAEVQQVVVNLVDNAIYWLSTVRDRPRKVHVSVRRLDDGAACLTVDDSGPGVPHDIRDVIFEPYFTRREEGTGLGLAIAGEIVDDVYDGELTLVESDLGGAAFQAVFRRRV
ncbi:ATP-binding protein [Micromonospora sp. C28SCA-DRY-2]|uniref:sensor histidine kinase n=1 Tax=Micromonospora sp. C28SCA-DRY-2 TaxID=3059522 RepID=UPI002675B418|nr:ATP-binding protein [Micromonospora sp. C28SCA-DRY-2]MDO3704076.1 ATP-binding protein [Micromonospora sp. C28SCA-DRY-2]